MGGVVNARAKVGNKPFELFLIDLQKGTIIDKRENEGSKEYKINGDFQIRRDFVGDYLINSLMVPNSNTVILRDMDKQNALQSFRCSSENGIELISNIDSIINNKKLKIIDKKIIEFN